MAENISENEAKTLLRIYIGQNIRSEGILQSDVGDVEVVGRLISKKLVKENHWYLPEYLTTDGGTDLAKSLVERKIDVVRKTLYVQLKRFPRRSLASLSLDTFSEAYLSQAK